MNEIRKVILGLPLFKVLGVVLFSVSLFACAGPSIIGDVIDRTELVDGEYQGTYGKFPNKAVVTVSIKDKKLVSIDILKHTASSKGKKADQAILERIIASQSTKVDAVTGATRSSRVIMNAVQKAIDKAYKKH